MIIERYISSGKTNLREVLAARFGLSTVAGRGVQTSEVSENFGSLARIITCHLSITETRVILNFARGVEFNKVSGRGILWSNIVS